MFGYVIVNPARLSPEAKERYQQSYCGLCRRLGALHGLLGRLTLSYDLTFLDVLLSSLYEGECACRSGCGRCPMHPLRARPWRAAEPADYCADLSVALHYYSAEDKWQDDRSLPALALMRLLRRKLPAVEARWPRQCGAIRTCLARLRALERADSRDLDAVSGCFGALMAELFDYRQDRWSPQLRAMGDSLGRFIYLLDAADDLPRDRRRGAYNPLRDLAQDDGWQDGLRQSLDALMARCVQAFEVLPCVEDTDILRNILYSGVWMRWPQGPAPARKTPKN